MDQLTKTAAEEFAAMKKACPWFDERIHFTVVLEDDNGNIEEIIGCARSRENADFVLGAAYDRRKPHQQPGLLINGKHRSFVMTS